MMYQAQLSNSWCVGEFVTSAFIGGVSLEENRYRFPPEVLDRMEQLSNAHAQKQICLEICVTARLESQQLTDRLKPFFEKQANATIPQRFRGSNPLDQRPAVTSGELFDPLVELVSPIWERKNFVVIQEGRNPIMSCTLTVEGELADQVMRLIGY